MGKRTKNKQKSENPYQTEIDKFKKQIEDMGREPFNPKVVPMKPDSPVKPMMPEPMEPSIPWGKSENDNTACLHSLCTLCNGTGINKVTGGMCVHNLYCPCPRCSAYCSSQ